MKPKQALTAVIGIALIILFIILALKLAPKPAGSKIVPYGITTNLSASALKQSAPKASGDSVALAKYNEQGMTMARTPIMGRPRTEQSATAASRFMGITPPPPRTVRAGIEESDVKVTLQMDPLKMGGASALTYLADFNGNYLVKNFEEAESRLTFYFPFPPNSDALYDVMLQVKGQEPKDALYTGEGIQYTDTFSPGEERPIQITYKAYGAGSFNYGLEHDRRVRKLSVRVEVKGVEAASLVANCLMPTERKAEKGTTTYAWALNNLITRRDIGVDLPHPRTEATKAPPGMSPGIATFLNIAPLLFLGFLFTLVITARSQGRPEVPWGTLVASSVAFFMFYPCLGFLLVRLPALPSVILSLIPGSLVVLLFLIGHARLSGALVQGVVPLALLQGGCTLALLVPGRESLLLVLFLVLYLAWLLWMKGILKASEHGLASP